MRAGRLDRRVTIQRATRTRDPSTGEQNDVWADLGAAWAEKIEGRVLERYAASQKLAEAEVAFRMRWWPALLTLTAKATRLLYGEREFDILGVQELGRREGVIAFCVARADGTTAQGLAPEAL